MKKLIATGLFLFVGLLFVGIAHADVNYGQYFTLSTRNGTSDLSEPVIQSGQSNFPVTIGDFYVYSSVPSSTPVEFAVGTAWYGMSCAIGSSLKNIFVNDVCYLRYTPWASSISYQNSLPDGQYTLISTGWSGSTGCKNLSLDNCRAFLGTIEEANFGIPVCTNCAGAAPGIENGTLQQYSYSGTNTIARGDTSGNSAIIFGATLQSGAVDQVRLEVEVQPVGVPFTNVPRAVGVYASHGAVTIPPINLPDGSYHWQARAADMNGSYSPWQPFNSTGAADFTVNTSQPFTQMDDSATSQPSWYSDNWYRLGTGFAGTIHSITLEGAVDGYGASHIHLNEFNDFGYSQLNKTYTITDNAPLAYGTFTKVTFDNLNITLDTNKYYRLDTYQGRQNASIILKGTNSMGTAMWNYFSYGIGRIEYYYQFYPYIVANKTVPPTLANLRQYKSDATSTIDEGQTTTEDTVVFRASVSGTSGNAVELEVEASSTEGYTTSTIGDAAPSGSVATVTLSGLPDGHYHWRARAVDASTTASSDWQEFGTPGNTDFVVHTVPLYTQNSSTWAGDSYGNGGIGGFIEYTVALSAADNFTLTVNAKDTSAPNNKRATYQVNLYSTTSSISNSLVNQSISLPSGDDNYKDASLDLGTVPAGNYKLRLTSERVYVDPSSPTFVKTLAYVNSINIVGARSGINVIKLATDNSRLTGGITLFDTTINKTVAQIDRYGCGRNLAQCGCFVSSMAMLLHYFPNPHHDDADPSTLNTFFKNDNAYSIAGDFLDKNSVNRYSSFRVIYDVADSSNAVDQFSKIRNFINQQGIPVISREASGRGGVNVEHFLVVDNALANSYFGVKDPYWYNTTNLNVGYTDTAHFIRNYEGHSDGLRVFALGTGAPDAAYSAIDIGSPAELLITDPQGRKLGRDPATNIAYNNIPGGTYLVENIDNPTDDSATRSSDHKIAYIPLPASGQYDVKVIGTNTGNYSLTTVNADAQNHTQSQVLFGNIQQNLSVGYNLAVNPQSATSSQVVPQDTTPPTISHTPLANRYFLNASSTQFTFGATDAGTGIYSVTATLDSQPIVAGYSINFGVVGPHSIVITASDFVGNTISTTINYNVAYKFSGFLPPIKSDGSGIYNLGRTLPIKFRLTDASSAFISTAVAQLVVTNVQSGISGTVPVALATSTNDTGNLFRYDSLGNQYIYNLDTSTLTPGTWQLKVILDDGTNYVVIVSLR